MTIRRKVCDRYFGEPRRHGSHLEPMVQRKGMAKPYPVLKAVEREEV